MPTRRFKRIAQAQLLVGTCAAMFSGACALFEHAQAQPGASTALPADHADNTKHNTLNTNHCSKW